MTTATAAMAAPQSPPTLDRLATWLLWLFVASLQMSIAAAGVLLALLVVCWVALLVRDRMGVKPLVYAHHDGELAFGSTVRAVLPYLPEARRGFSACATAG